jgi:pyruvate dehydrogenase E2 component (dihydrolipoamide acetyltransferase)
MDLNPLTKELYYIGIRRRNSTVDSLLAIIGKEGEDVAALIAGQSAPETEAAKSETEKLLPI